VEHRDARTEIYSRKLCAEMILSASRQVKGNNYHKIQALMKTAVLLDELHRYGSITPEMLSPFETVSPNCEFAMLIKEYGNNALFSGKLREVTVRNAKSIIKGFMLELESTGFTSFEGVTFSIIGVAVTKFAASNYKGGATSLLHYARDFLKYLYEYGVTETDMSFAVPKIAAPSRKVYQGFTDDEIKNLLAAVDLNTKIGKRDYAMMTLAAQTGILL